jgi:hemoglobin-like flavoprotein
MELVSYLREVVSAEWAADFYRRFFALRPDARAMFQTSPAAQADKFSATLAVLINEADRPSLEGELFALGRRHLEYGVNESLYVDALTALMETLRTAKPEAWRPEWEADVTALYWSILSRMHPESGGHT